MLIYLIGFMGSGKTTAGKKLAAKLNYRFIDLDHMIENSYRITIPDIFSRYNEEAFRKMEKCMLHKTFSENDAVIATGGGTPCFFDNMTLINSKGISVYIEMSPEALSSRLLVARKKRPLVDKSERELLDFVRAKLAEREKYYEMAHIRANGIDLDPVQLASVLLTFQK